LLLVTRSKREHDHVADYLVAGQVLAQGVGVPAWPHAFPRAIASGQLNRGAAVGLVLDLLGCSSSAVRKQVYAQYQRGLLRGFDGCGASASEVVVELGADDALRRPPNTEAGYQSTTLPPGVSGYR
jgi:hypothetical protein